MEAKEPDCEHEWVKKTDSDGDGIYFRQWDYWECILCGEQKDFPLSDYGFEDE